MSSDSVMAGPDWLAATVPVSTKMPVPMVAPMPIDISDQALRACFRRSAPALSRAWTGRTANNWRSREGLATGCRAPLSVASYIAPSFAHSSASRMRRADGARVAARPGCPAAKDGRQAGLQHQLC